MGLFISLLRYMWWVLSFILFAYTVRNEGLVKGVVAWINPITPP